MVDNQVYFLDRSPGWQENPREDQKLLWDHITTDNVVRTVDNGDFYTETRGRWRQNTKWQVKADSLVSNLNGWRVLVSDYICMYF